MEITPKCNCDGVKSIGLQYWYCGFFCLLCFVFLIECGAQWKCNWEQNKVLTWCYLGQHWQRTMWKLMILGIASGKALNFPAYGAYTSDLLPVHTRSSVNCWVPRHCFLLAKVGDVKRKGRTSILEHPVCLKARDSTARSWTDYWNLEADVFRVK